jgi:hypothetical protein
VADKKLIEKYGRPHPAVSIGRPSVSPKLSHILDTFLIWSLNNKEEANKKSQSNAGFCLCFCTYTMEAKN